MQLQCFMTLWGFSGSLKEAVIAAHKNGFDGIEGPAPESSDSRREFRAQLDDSGLSYIAEICTAGSYVPDRHASLDDHLASFRAKAEMSLECAPRFLTVIAGCDAWPLAQSVEFFAQAHEAAKQFGFVASFETHRSRSLFNPWTCRDILRQLPKLKLTCDFSHWCCVCERLIGTEPEVLELCAKHAHHIHARVGYDQGPQVPHPAAPEYWQALEAHEEWWTQIWRAQRERGVAVSTITPEFGPDGYLHHIPFTDEPVADLFTINCWMAARERQRFAEVGT